MILLYSLKKYGIIFWMYIGRRVCHEIKPHNALIKTTHFLLQQSEIFKRICSYFQQQKMKLNEILLLPLMLKSLSGYKFEKKRQRTELQRNFQRKSYRREMNKIQEHTVFHRTFQKQDIICLRNETDRESESVKFNVVKQSREHEHSRSMILQLRFNHVLQRKLDMNYECFSNCDKLHFSLTRCYNVDPLT